MEYNRVLKQGSKIYIVVNNSNKVLIINRYTGQLVGNINTGLVNPRYLVVKNNNLYSNTLYISCWGNPTNPTDDYIAVINDNNYGDLFKIMVTEGPEKLLIHNNNLYVAHKGGFSNGNSVSVINTTNNSVTNTFTTGDIPNGLAIFNNELYVFCSGKTVYDTNWNIIEKTGGKLKSYNLTNYSEIQSVDFGNTQQPSNFVVDQDKLYYSLNGQIFQKTITSSTIPSSALFNPQVTNLYALNIIEDKIYVCDAKNFNSAGNLKIFNLLIIRSNKILSVFKFTKTFVLSYNTVYMY
jgi:YVTN family beta-propeller protein